MSVDVGSAVGHLDLDIGGFLDGLKSAHEAAENTTASLSKTFKDLGKSITDIGKSFSLYVSTPIIGAGAALLKFGSDFETEMKNISAITGMTGEELATFEEGIKNIAIATGTSQAELAKAGKMVAEAGGDMKTMLAQLEAGSNLAIASQTDLSTTLDMVGSTMKTFGLSAEDARSVVDSLASVTTLANTTLSDINQAFVNCGGSAAQAGLSIDDVNAMLITFSNAGLKGGAAGTALNRMLQDLASPTSKAKEALDELSVSLYDNEGASRNMFDIMQDLQHALSNLSDEERNAAEDAIFNTVSLKGWHDVTAVGIESIRELSGELSKSVDAFDGMGQAAGMAATQNESLAATMKSIYPILEELGKVVLENLKPSIVWLAETLKDWLKWFAELPAPVQTTVIAIAALAAAIGPLLVVVGTFITSIGTVIGAFKTIIALAPMLGTAWTIATGPIGLAIAAIAALIAIIGTIIYYWDDIKAATAAFWEWFSSGWTDFGEWFADSWKSVWDGVAGYMAEFWEQFAEHWNGFWSAFGEHWNSIWEWFTEGWKTVWDWISQYVGYIAEGIKNVVSKIGEWLKWAIDVVWNTAKNVINAALNIGKNIVEGVWQGIQNAATWFYNQITGFFSGMIVRAKQALGIASPSQLFADSIGKWIPAGIAEGFEDAMPKALRDMQSVLDAGMRMLSADDVVLDYAFAPAKNRSGGWDNGGSLQMAEGSTGGGNTYNFYSPEPITEAVARREMEQLSRNMAFGF